MEAIWGLFWQDQVHISGMKVPFQNLSQVALEEKGSQGMVRLEIRSSVWMFILWASGNLLGLATLVHCNARMGGVGVILGLSQMVCAYSSLRRDILHDVAGAVRRVDVAGDGNLLVVTQSGRRQKGEVRSFCFVAPFLVVLYWRGEQGGGQRPIVLSGDAVEQESLRRLRVLLRHPL
ncbi:MAG: hypothetical protein G3H99_01970 [Ferrovum sp.]|nr:hypothetical protein [Ferrovum sp.]NDU86960.1 hypothetical protein [Ferrovum sp.]